MSLTDQHELITQWNKESVLPGTSMSIKYSTYISDTNINIEGIQRKLKLLHKWEKIFDQFINDNSNSTYNLSLVTKEHNIILDRIAENKEKEYLYIENSKNDRCIIM
jgi:hypothetical protein